MGGKKNDKGGVGAENSGGCSYSTRMSHWLTRSAFFHSAHPNFNAGEGPHPPLAFGHAPPDLQFPKARDPVYGFDHFNIL